MLKSVGNPPGVRTRAALACIKYGRVYDAVENCAGRIAATHS